MFNTLLELFRDIQVFNWISVVIFIAIFVALNKYIAMRQKTKNTPNINNTVTQHAEIQPIQLTSEDNSIPVDQSVKQSVNSYITSIAKVEDNIPEFSQEVLKTVQAHDAQQDSNIKEPEESQQHNHQNLIPKVSIEPIVQISKDYKSKKQNNIKRNIKAAPAKYQSKFKLSINNLIDNTHNVNYVLNKLKTHGYIHLTSQYSSPGKSYLADIIAQNLYLSEDYNVIHLNLSANITTIDQALEAYKIANSYQEFIAYINNSLVCVIIDNTEYLEVQDLELLHSIKWGQSVLITIESNTEPKKNSYSLQNLTNLDISQYLLRQINNPSYVNNQLINNIGLSLDNNLTALRLLVHGLNNNIELSVLSSSDNDDKLSIQSIFQQSLQLLNYDARELLMQIYNLPNELCSYNLLQSITDLSDTQLDQALANLADYFCVTLAYSADQATDNKFYYINKDWLRFLNLYCALPECINQDDLLDNLFAYIREMPLPTVFNKIQGFIEYLNIINYLVKAEYNSLSFHFLLLNFLEALEHFDYINILQDNVLPNIYNRLNDNQTINNEIAYAISNLYCPNNTEANIKRIINILLKHTHNQKACYIHKYLARAYYKQYQLTNAVHSLHLAIKYNKIAQQELCIRPKEEAICKLEQIEYSQELYSINKDLDILKNIRHIILALIDDMPNLDLSVDFQAQIFETAGNITIQLAESMKINKNINILDYIHQGLEYYDNALQITQAHGDIHRLMVLQGNTLYKIFEHSKSLDYLADSMKYFRQALDLATVYKLPEDSIIQNIINLSITYKLLAREHTPIENYFQSWKLLNKAYDIARNKPLNIANINQTIEAHAIELYHELSADAVLNSDRCMEYIEIQSHIQKELQKTIA